MLVIHLSVLLEMLLEKERTAKRKCNATRLGGARDLTPVERVKTCPVLAYSSPRWRRYSGSVIIGGRS